MTAMKALGTLGLVVALAAPMAAQDPLLAAKDLYAAASYEEALSSLALLSNGAAPEVAQAVNVKSSH